MTGYCLRGDQLCKFGTVVTPLNFKSLLPEASKDLNFPIFKLFLVFLYMKQNNKGKLVQSLLYVLDENVKFECYNLLQYINQQSTPKTDCQIFFYLQIGKFQLTYSSNHLSELVYVIQQFQESISFVCNISNPTRVVADILSLSRTFLKRAKVSEY